MVGRIILLLVSVMPTAALADSHGGGFHHSDMSFGMGYMFMGPVMMLLFLGILIALIVLLVRWLGGGRSVMSPHQSNRGLEILEERFARGEIEREEFMQKKSDLGA